MIVSSYKFFFQKEIKSNCYLLKIFNFVCIFANITKSVKIKQWQLIHDHCARRFQRLMPGKAHTEVTSTDC